MKTAIETALNNFPELYRTSFKETVTFLSSSSKDRKRSLGYATLHRGNTRVNQHYYKHSLNYSKHTSCYILHSVKPFHTPATPLAGSLTGVT